jgi:repressor LexA
MSIGENIKKLLKSKNITQKKLANDINESEINISRWLKDNFEDENSRRMPLEVLKKIAEYLDTTIDVLLGEKTLQIKVIPLIGKSSCGIPKDYDLNGYEPVPIPSSMYKDGMYAVEADGDSMSPKINNGDIVYCQPNRIIDNGNIVHYWLDGDSGIKRYKMNEARTVISLVPINSDYDIITIHCDENVDLRMARVVGKIDKDF